MSDGDDVNVSGPDSIRDDVRKPAYFELTRRESATPRRPDFRKGLNQCERAGHGVEQPTTPARATFFVPADGLSQFKRGGLADL